MPELTFMTKLFEFRQTRKTNIPQKSHFDSHFSGAEKRGFERRTSDKTDFRSGKPGNGIIWQVF
jgi:hypothetical protein